MEKEKQATGWLLLWYPLLLWRHWPHWRLFGQLGLLWQLPSHFVSHPPVNHWQTSACDPSRMADINQGMIRVLRTEYPCGSRRVSKCTKSPRPFQNRIILVAKRGGWRDWSYVRLLKVNYIEAKYQCVKRQQTTENIWSPIIYLLHQLLD